MKRFILFSLLIFAALVGNGQNKTGYISTGKTVLDKPMTFTASDFVEADDTFRIDITSEQVYPCKQNLYSSLTTVSGSPSVDIKLFGKCFSNDAYVQIGSTITWTSASNNPVNISAVTPNQYRYYQVLYIASSATQKVKVTAFELKIWYTSGLASSGTLTDGTATINSGAATGITTIAASGRITGTGGATITGAATNINASSNFATNINTGTTNAALSLGGGSGTVAVNSSAWDISATGAATGLISATVTKDGDNVILDPGADLHAIDVQINSASKFSVDSAGVVTSAGAINAGNGVSLGTSKALTGTTALTIGDNNQTVAVNSSSWDITAAGVFSGMLRNVITDATGAKTLAATDANSVLFCTAAGGATTVTIPDPSAATVGVIYYIIQTADQNLVVTATNANGNSIVCDGVATSDNVTISTAGHKIGAGMIVIGLSATQWYVGGLNPESVLTPEGAD